MDYWLTKIKHMIIMIMERKLIADESKEDGSNGYSSRKDVIEYTEEEMIIKDLQMEDCN